MSEVLDVALTIRKIEIEGLSVTSSKPVNRVPILRKEAELDTPKIIIANTVHVDGVATRSCITPIDGIGSNRFRILGRQTRPNVQELRLQIYGGGKEIILFCPSRKLVEVGRQDRFECICVYAPQKPLLVLECATFTASHVPEGPCTA